MLSKKQKDVSCDFCHQMHYDTSRYYTHANKQHLDQLQKSWTKCDLCKMYFPCYDVVERHKSQSHSVKPKTTCARFKCSFCTKTYSLGSLVYRHSNSAHHSELSGAGWLQCSVCSQFYPSKNVLDLHKIQSHGLAKQSDKGVQCPFCPKHLSEGADFYKHCNKWHTESLSDWHACNECGKKFPEFSVLSNHRLRVHSKPKFKSLSTATITCTLCPRIQNSIQEHYLHVNKVHLDAIENDWPVCSLCKLHLPGQTELQFHMFTNHSEGKNEGQDRTGKRIYKTPERVKCNFCNNTCATKSIYYKHANIFHLDIIQDEWYNCDQCNTFFPSESVLKLHEKQMHLTLPANRALKRLECNFCHVMLTDKSEFHKHANRDHQDQISNWLICDKCQWRLPDEFSLKNHQYHVHTAKRRRGKKRTRQAAVQTSVICQFCDLKLTTQESFYRHANVAHPEEIEEENWDGYCSTCDTRLPDTHGSLEKHIYVAHTKAEKASKEKIQCNFCPNTFAKHRLFINHANQFHWDDVAAFWILCDTCMIYFPTQQVLDKHQMMSHKNSETETGEENQVSKTETVSCSFCPSKFSRNTVFYVHANDFHATELKAQNWPECQKCGLYFPTGFALKNHESHRHGNDSSSKERTRSQQCSYCSQTFKDSNKMYQHATDHHLDKISTIWLKCEPCQLYIPSKGGLNIHQMKCHPKSKKDALSLTCSFCDAIFSTPKSLYSHANKVHSENLAGKWIQCHQCTFRFPNKKALKSHSLSHAKKQKIADPSSHYENVCEVVKSESKHEVRQYEANDQGRFECQFCPEQLKTLADLYGHSQQVHLEQVFQQWIPCDFCSSYFPTQDALEEHLQICKKDSECVFSCDYCDLSFSSESDLTEHIIINHVAHHNDNESSYAKIEDPDAQDDKSSLNLNGLEAHQLCEYCGTSHENPDQCPRKESDNWITCVECYLSFQDEATLRSHHESVHAEPQLHFAPQDVACLVEVSPFVAATNQTVGADQVLHDKSPEVTISQVQMLAHKKVQKSPNSKPVVITVPKNM